jgi:cysteine desulfurase/selenocysteine lyase
MYGADDIAAAAKHLLADAVAASGPAVPAAAIQHDAFASLRPPGEAGRRPGEGAPEIAQIPSTLTPTLSQRERVTTGTRRVEQPWGAAAPPVADLSGVRAFVGRIRGLDHLQLPPVRFDRPLAPSAAAGSIGHFNHGLLDVDAIRRDFPILREQVHGKPLAWFDNAATTQKPQAVIDAIAHFYAHDNSNIHRGAHTLAARATDAYEHARQTVATFLGANGPDEILFVRGCTEGINLVANILAPGISRGDEILLTELEHHANIVPWQMVAERTGAILRVAPIDDRGEVILEAYEGLLGSRTKVVALSHASNSLGTILPAELMTAMAKARGARVLVDGAQSVSHFPVDVRRIGCDFYVFSGHKIFGPTGIGAVFMRKEAQASLPPWQGGGNMIKDVTFAHTTYAEPPAKFEAGTPNIADAIGLGAALDYVTRLGREQIAAYEHHLLDYATGRLSGIDGLRLIGTAREKVGVLSFVIPGLDPIEIGKALDREGIAVRAGHHCAQPSLRHFGVEATVRPSLAFYNTTSEIDRLADAVVRLARRRL